MNNAPAIKAGDRIKAVIEGVVSHVDRDGEAYVGPRGAMQASFYPASKTVTSVEIIKPPLAVGICGWVSELNAPIGALLRCTRNQFHILAVAGGKFAGTGGFEPKPADYYNDLYEVVYLPAAAASSTCEGGC